MDGRPSAEASSPCRVSRRHSRPGPAARGGLLRYRLTRRAPGACARREPSPGICPRRAPRRAAMRPAAAPAVPRPAAGPSRCPAAGLCRPCRPARLTAALLRLNAFLMAATVFAARPTEWPIARSDMCGCDAMIRSAAARRSAWDSGRPWATFSWTARRKTSASLPVEEYDVDCLPSLQGRGHQAVHPVDHPHGAPVHQDRRKRRLRLGEPRDMRLVLAVQPRRVGRAEGEDGNGPHLGRGARGPVAGC